MDFTENPPVEIELGHNAEYYKDVVQEYTFNPPRHVPRHQELFDAYTSVEGIMSIDGSDRNVFIHLTHGVSDSFSTEVEDGDTIYGVPLKTKPAKVNKKLRKMGHKTFKSLHDIALIDERIVLVFNEFQANDIVWYDKNNTTVEELRSFVA